MNEIQSKDHRRGTYKMNGFLLPHFDDKKYTQNNGYDGLALSLVIIINYKNSCLFRRVSLSSYKNHYFNLLSSQMTFF